MEFSKTVRYSDETIRLTIEDKVLVIEIEDHTKYHYHVENLERAFRAAKEVINNKFGKMNKKDFFKLISLSINCTEICEVPVQSPLGQNLVGICLEYSPDYNTNNKPFKVKTPDGEFVSIINSRYIKIYHL